MMAVKPVPKFNTMDVKRDHFYRLKQLAYLDRLEMPLHLDGFVRVLLHNNRWMVICDKVVLAISDSRHHVGPNESLRLADEMNQWRKIPNNFQVRAENPIAHKSRILHMKKAYKMFKRQKKYRDFGDKDA
jgi:hypothetical protein